MEGVIFLDSTKFLLAKPLIPKPTMTCGGLNRICGKQVNRKKKKTKN